MGPHRVLLWAIAIVGIVVALGGCAGMGFEEIKIPDFPQLTLILRVQDPAGDPIGNARVFVDGHWDEWTTNGFFEPLGADFPAAWVGFPANWVSEEYQITDPIGSGPARFDIAVRKVGWTSDLTIVELADTNAHRYFVRDTMTLYPEGGGPQPPVLHYAEVIASNAAVGPAATPRTSVGERAP